MAEIVNLRRVRKARLRSHAAAEAAASRITHGRTKAEREAANATIRDQKTRLDHARLDRDSKPRE